MLFNHQNFKDLSEVYSTDSPCVSIYIPTHRAGRVQEDIIRFKNALSEVKNKLQEDNHFLNGPLNEREAEGFLVPAYDLLDNEDFWLHQSDSLAVFIGKDVFEYYAVPIDIQPLTYVKHQFYLSPLVPLLSGDDRFFLLALSQGDVRFFEAHRYSITPVEIRDLLPRSLEEAMALEDPEKSVQHHGAGSSTIHHGQGVNKDQLGWQLKQFCRMVDKGLMEMLHDEKAPLIIAAVDELVPVYREISKYKHLADAHISGNPDEEGPSQLHEKAWSKMKNHFRNDFEEVKESFGQAMTNGKAATLITDIAPAARNGRVDSLFISKDLPLLWGEYVEATNTVKLHEEEKPYSVCLHDLAVTKTFEQGGHVFQTDQTDMPQVTSKVNAIFRY